MYSYAYMNVYMGSAAAVSAVQKQILLESEGLMS